MKVNPSVFDSVLATGTITDSYTKELRTIDPFGVRSFSLPDAVQYGSVAEAVASLQRITSRLHTQHEETLDLAAAAMAAYDPSAGFT